MAGAVAGEHLEIFLAIRPDDNETFYREVDEELRRDQMKTYWERYGKLVIAGVVLLLAAIGGFIWWQNQQEVKAGEARRRPDRRLRRHRRAASKAAAIAQARRARQDRGPTAIAPPPC